MFVMERSIDKIILFSDGIEIFEDDKLKCYMDCLLHEKGMILPDGRIDLVNLHESFSDDEEIHLTYIHMIRKCLYPKGEGCERAFNLNSCFKKADPRVSFWFMNVGHQITFQINSFLALFFDINELWHKNADQRWLTWANFSKISACSVWWNVFFNMMNKLHLLEE